MSIIILQGSNAASCMTISSLIVSSSTIYYTTVLIMIGIDNDECSHWFFGRLRTRLNNIRLPIGEIVTLTFERRVHPNYFLMHNEEGSSVTQQEGKGKNEEINIEISPLPSPVKPSSTILSSGDDISSKFNLRNEIFLVKDDTIDVERDEDKYVSMEARKNNSDPINEASVVKEFIGMDDVDADADIDDNDDDDYDDNNSTEIPPPPPYPYNEDDDLENDDDKHPLISAIMTQVDDALHQTRSKLEQAQHDTIKYAQMCDSLRVENDTLKDTVKSLVNDYYQYHTRIIIA